MKEQLENPFHDIVVKEILSYRSHSKTICLLCTWKEQQAIVTMERLFLCDVNPYEDLESIASVLHGLAKKPTSSEDSHDATSSFQNDIYESMVTTLQEEAHNVFKVMTVCPATDVMVDKYRFGKRVTVRETAAIYHGGVKEFVHSQPPIEWIENILNKKREVDRLVCTDEDPKSGFVLLPDFKWDGSVATLYCLAICQNRAIRSIRDLNEEHLPLLENIKSKSTEAIHNRWGIKENQLRFFVHYHPSFYHFHVHVSFVNREAVNIEADRAHMLDSIIDNIRTWPDFYQRATLCYRIDESGKHPLGKFVLQ